MNLSEQHIKVILKETKIEYPNDAHFENDVMNSIDNLKGYDSIIDRSKRRARIGLRACLLLVVFLIISIVYPLVSTHTQVLEESNALLPSVNVIIILVILFALLQGSRGVWIQKMNLEK